MVLLYLYSISLPSTASKAYKEEGSEIDGFQRNGIDINTTYYYIINILILYIHL